MFSDETMDINPILERWKHQSGQTIQARVIVGTDGKRKVQLRLEMGLMQMELRGRPDGLRPHNFESLLDFHKHRLVLHRLQQGSEEGFKLTHEECQAMQRESLQYYHRRISLLEVGEFELAEHDASHNLEILDLLKNYAEKREDWMGSEQFRAFIISHRTGARALGHMDKGEHDAALRALEQGMEEIRQVFRSYDQEGLIEQSSELKFLEGLQEQVMQRRPPSERDRLTQDLQEAVTREEYERAAVIRDLLRNYE